MEVETFQRPLDLIEVARDNRAEGKKRPQIHQISVDIADRLNRFFKEQKGRELGTQEPAHEEIQLPIAGEDPIKVTIYTVKDVKWDRRSFGASCFGIVVEHTGQRLELTMDRERSLREVRLVHDASDAKPSFEQFPTLAEVEAYRLLLDRIGM